MGRPDPALACLAGLLIARAHDLLGDGAAARERLRRAERCASRLTQVRGDGLRERLDEFHGHLDAVVPKGPAGTVLTPAEHRVLGFLATHFTLAEIAERLYVSRNTVKSQALSIYQKLGASNRSQAVESARQSGLLGV